MIFKHYIRFYTSKLFSQVNLISYSFLSYYFLSNQNFIINQIKKRILVYRITSIIVHDYISLIFDKIHWDIDVEAHEAIKPSRADVYKTWHVDAIRSSSSRKDSNSRIAPISPTDEDAYEKNLTSTASPERKPINLLNLNPIFVFLWNLIVDWSVITFTDILNIIKNQVDFIDLSNHKYSLELISWQILNSNNKKYIYQTQDFFKFKYIFKNIRINNIITNYLSKYIKNEISLFTYYPKDYFINMTFTYTFIRDIFFRIAAKKSKDINVIHLLKKKKFILSTYKLFYCRFFYWQIQDYISILKYWSFYHNLKFIMTIIFLYP